jgi:hypothetical protein
MASGPFPRSKYDRPLTPKHQPNLPGLAQIVYKNDVPKNLTKLPSLPPQKPQGRRIP